MYHAGHCKTFQISPSYSSSKWQSVSVVSPCLVNVTIWPLHPRHDPQKSELLSCHRRHCNKNNTAETTWALKRQSKLNSPPGGKETHALPLTLTCRQKGKETRNGWGVGAQVPLCSLHVWCYSWEADNQSLTTSLSYDRLLGAMAKSNNRKDPGAQTWSTNIAKKITDAW